MLGSEPEEEMDDWEEGEEVLEMEIDREEDEDDDIDILDCIVTDAFRVDENDGLTYEALAQKKREAALLHQQGSVCHLFFFFVLFTACSNFSNLLAEMSGLRGTFQKMIFLAPTSKTFWKK